jgi:hypothetical protein
MRSLQSLAAGKGGALRHTVVRCEHLAVESHGATLLVRPCVFLSFRECLVPGRGVRIVEVERLMQDVFESGLVRVSEGIGARTLKRSELVQAPVGKSIDNACLCCYPHRYWRTSTCLARASAIGVSNGRGR